MIYTAIDTFYVPDEQLENSPSRKDGIDESTEMILRVYGCDLIQESGILLKLPQASMATGQVLFHRFYCKKSFARYNVKLVAASCIWLAAKLEESPRKAKHVFMVFHRMELRRASKAIEQFDFFSTKYTELKAELNKTERQILKEMGFVCHVEHPHKFIPTYLETLGAPKELRQEAWNLANDSLRTTLCVRFKSEIVACGVVYAAARRFQLPLPEDPPWWKIFGAEKPGIDEVCRVLAKLYSLPKAQYVPVCKEKDFVLIKSRETKMRTANGTPNSAITASETRTANPENSSAKELVKVALEINKAVEDTTSVPAAEGGVPGESGSSKSKADQGKGDINGVKIKDKEQERDRSKGRDREDRERDRGRDSDREKRDRGRDSDREIRDKYKDRSRHRSNDKGKDSGYLEKPEKPRHHSSRDRDYLGSSYLSSREKDRHRHIH